MLNKGKIELSSVEYNIESPFTVSKNKDYELNICGLNIKGLSISEISNFIENKRFLLTNEVEGIVKEEEYYLIAETNKELTNKSEQLYTVSVSGIEYTHLLQQIIIPSKSFRQPNDVNLTRWTIDGILEYLREWQMVKGKIEFVIDNELLNKIRGIRTPNLEFKDATLYEILKEILAIADAIPVLKYDGETNTNIITANFPNDRNNSINSRTNVNQEEIKGNSSEAVGNIYTRLENVSPSETNVVTYPQVGFATPRSKTFFLSQNENAFIPTGNKPIYDLVKVEFNLNSLPSNFSIRFAQIGGGGGSISLNQIKNILGDIADITSNIVEEKVLDALGTQGLITDVNKRSVLSYKQGEVGINNLVTYESGATGSVIYNLIVSVLYQNPDGKRLIDNTTGLPVVQSFSDEAFANLSFRTTMRSTEDIVIEHTRLQNRDYNGTTKVLNQQSRRIDPRQAGFQAIATLERMGLQERKISITTSKEEELYDLGDFDVNEIVSKYERVYNNTSITTIYTLNKNFNKTAEDIQVKSEIRTYNIDASSFVEREDIVKEYIVCGFNAILPNSNVIVDQTKFLNGFLQSENTSTVPVLKTEINGLDFNGSKKYETDIENQFFLPDFTKTAIGRSMLFSVSLPEPANAGTKLLANRDVEPIPYVYLGDEVEYQGEFERLDLAIGESLINEPNPNTIPLLEQTGDNASELLNNTFIELKDYEYQKDKGENTKITLQFEAVTTDLGVYIAPKFIESHTLIEGVNASYSVVSLNEDAPYITQSNSKYTNDLQTFEISRKDALIRTEKGLNSIEVYENSKWLIIDDQNNILIACNNDGLGENFSLSIRSDINDLVSDLYSGFIDIGSTRWLNWGIGAIDEYKVRYAGDNKVAVGEGVALVDGFPYISGQGTYEISQDIRLSGDEGLGRFDTQRLVIDTTFPPLGNLELIGTQKTNYRFTGINTIASNGISLRDDYFTRTVDSISNSGGIEITYEVLTQDPGLELIAELVSFSSGRTTILKTKRYRINQQFITVSFDSSDFPEKGDYRIRFGLSFEFIGFFQFVNLTTKANINDTSLDQRTNLEYRIGDQTIKTSPIYSSQFSDSNTFTYEKVTNANEEVAMYLTFNGETKGGTLWETNVNIKKLK